MGRTVHDRRLLQAYELLEEGQIDILSLDIFDTFLWRQVPTPRDLFLILGRQLKERGWLRPNIPSPMFAQLRSLAESTARKRKSIFQNTTEVSLPEIYWELQPIFVTLTLQQMLGGAIQGIYEGDTTPLVNLEVQLEATLLHCNTPIMHLVNYAHQQQIPVILVSDTYFESHHIRDFLSLWPENDKLYRFYLSCEYGAHKEEDLWDVVLADLKIKPHRLLHIGDHATRDVESPRQRGIQVLHYPKSDGAFEEICDREWSQKEAPRSVALDNLQGDFGLTTIRSSMAYHRDIEALCEEDRFYWRYGAQILGPILFGFIYWIYERCAALGVHEPFCLMREGKLYAHLIDRMAPYYPHHTLNPKLLWASRLFIIHAALAEANTTDLKGVMSAMIEQFTVEELSSYLGLPMDSLADWLPYRHCILEDKKLKKEWLRYLMNRPDLRLQILEGAAQKRNRFLKYISKLGVAESSTMTLVDVGWSGTAQRALHQIFSVEHREKGLQGLYLATTPRASQAWLQGCPSEGYLYQGGFPDLGNIHKTCFILEQTATAETGLGCLADIDVEGLPITHPFHISTQQKRQAEIIQQGIFAFFDTLGPLVQSRTIVWQAESEALKQQLRQIFSRSMLRATHLEAIKFEDWYHEHGPSDYLIQPLAKDSYYDRFITDMLPEAAFKASGLNWLSAYTAKKSSYLSHTSEALWLKKIPPKCFLSEDIFSLRIFVDRGEGFLPSPDRHIPLRSNPNRSFYALTKVYSSKKAMHNLLLQLSFPLALVRVESIRLIIYDQNSPHPQDLFFYQYADSHTLTCVRGQLLDFQTFYCQDYLQLLHVFTTPGTYQVNIQLSCQTLKFPPHLVQQSCFST